MQQAVLKIGVELVAATAPSYTLLRKITRLFQLKRPRGHVTMGQSNLSEVHGRDINATPLVTTELELRR